VIHEAACWSPLRREWIFLPRRVSSLPYDEELDEKMGSNKLVIADESFSKVRRGEKGTGSFSRACSLALLSLRHPFRFLPLLFRHIPLCPIHFPSLPVEGDLIPSFH
jgi:hypothetical protein